MEQAQEASKAPVRRQPRQRRPPGFIPAACPGSLDALDQLVCGERCEEQDLQADQQPSSPLAARQQLAGVEEGSEGGSSPRSPCSSPVGSGPATPACYAEPAPGAEQAAALSAAEERQLQEAAAAAAARQCAVGARPQRSSWDGSSTSGEETVDEQPSPAALSDSVTSMEGAYAAQRANAAAPEAPAVAAAQRPAGIGCC